MLSVLEMLKMCPPFSVGTEVSSIFVDFVILPAFGSVESFRGRRVKWRLIEAYIERPPMIHVETHCGRRVFESDGEDIIANWCSDDVFATRSDGNGWSCFNQIFHRLNGERSVQLQYSSSVPLLHAMANNLSELYGLTIKCECLPVGVFEKPPQNRPAYSGQTDHHRRGAIRAQKVYSIANTPRKQSLKRGCGLRSLKDEGDPAFAAVKIVEQRLDVSVRNIGCGL